MVHNGHLYWDCIWKRYWAFKIRDWENDWHRSLAGAHLWWIIELKWVPLTALCTKHCTTWVLLTAPPSQICVWCSSRFAKTLRLLRPVWWRWRWWLLRSDDHQSVWCSLDCRKSCGIWPFEKSWVLLGKTGELQLLWWYGNDSKYENCYGCDNDDDLPVYDSVW